VEGAVGVLRARWIRSSRAALIIQSDNFEKGDIFGRLKIVAPIDDRFRESSFFFLLRKLTRFARCSTFLVRFFSRHRGIERAQS